MRESGLLCTYIIGPQPSRLCDGGHIRRQATGNRENSPGFLVLCPWSKAARRSFVCRASEGVFHGLDVGTILLFSRLAVRRKGARPPLQSCHSGLDPESRFSVCRYPCFRLSGAYHFSVSAGEGKGESRIPSSRRGFGGIGALYQDHRTASPLVTTM